MAAFTHIIFDIDGTLIDSAESSLRSLQRLVEERTGSAPELSDLHFALGLAGEITLKRFGIYSQESMDRWAEIALGMADTLSVYPGVREALSELRAAGFDLGIVSSRYHGEYRDEVAPLGLDGFFGIKVLAEDTAEHKPEPAPMLEYLRRAGIDPGEAIYVGDTDYDRRCAQSAGVAFALAAWGAPQSVEDADFTLSTPSEVLAIACQERG